MTPYFAVIGILGFLALVQGAGARSRIWPGLALVVLLVFGALRYETGFDWAAYDWVYDLMPGLADVVRYRAPVPETDPPMEPGYVAVSILLKSVTDDAAVLL